MTDDVGPRPSLRRSATPAARPFGSGTGWIQPGHGDGSRVALLTSVACHSRHPTMLAEDLEVKMTAGESRALMWSGPTMAAPVGVVTLMKVMSLCFFRLPPRCSGGNPRSGFTGSDDGDTLSVVLPFEGIVLEHVMPGGVYWWSGVPFSASTMVARQHGAVDFRSGCV